LPAIGAALIETPKQAADCRVIRRNRAPPALGGGRGPRAFAAPQKQHPRRTPDRFPPPGQPPAAQRFGTL